MKQKITFSLLTSLLCSGFIFAQTVVNDFETGSAVVEPLFGASGTVVSNPSKSGLNTTDNCLQIGRTGSNWYELVRINVNPDLSISASDNKYLSVLVYGVTTDLGCRFDATGDTNTGTNGGIIRPDVLHSGATGWEQIIFPIKDGQAATNFTKGMLYNLIFHGDMGGSQVPGGFKLNNTDTFIYIDEIKILDNNPLSVSDLEFEKSVSLYPNPVQSVFKIKTQTNASIKNIAIYNILGKKVMEKMLSINTNECNISDLGTGVYLVEITNNNGGIVFKKIVKK